MFKKILLFIGMLLLIGGLVAVAFFGLDLNLFEIPSVADGIIPGLDLSGGTILTFEADMEGTPSADDMNTAQSLLRQRITALGFFEASIYPAGPRRITVEIPDIHDADEAMNLIGGTAQLEFRTFSGISLEEFEEGEFDPETYKLHEGTVHRVWIPSTAVNARAQFGQTTDHGGNVHHVTLEFAAADEDEWTAVTRHAASQTVGENYIALFMDDSPVLDENDVPFAPTVDAEYAATGIGRNAVVTFGTGRDAQSIARNFANIVNIGQLPFSLREEQRSVVGPTLGEAALNTSLLAGIIGLALIILFMLIFYRLPGLMAAIALLLYTALVAIVLAIMNINLSLPGIAGIILSIGMATDANIVIFERIKDELRSGKTVKSAVVSGFKRARVAIVDSNITTIIAGFVLFGFGTGPVQGFAVTLLVGVILSMFTALFITQLLIKQMAGLGIVNLWFYGVKQDRSEPRIVQNNFSFIKNFKWFGIPSAIICLFAVVSLVLTPFGVNLFNMDIDFTGGTTLQVDIGREVTDSDLDDAVAAVRTATGLDPAAPQRVANVDGDNTQILLRIPLIEDEEGAAGTQNLAMDALSEVFPDIDPAESLISFVGASIGEDLRRAAILSVIVASILILLYITIRFQFSSGLSSIISQLHDVGILLAAYIILQIPLNMTFIAVLLTTIGYQINATIILFDRIRENRKRMAKTSFGDIIDYSTKQTLGRNISTTISTLLPLVCIIIIGVQSVRDFAIPIAIGLVSGAYSSITIAGAIWHKIARADEKATKRLDEKIKEQ